MESSVNKDLLRGRVDTFVLNSLSEKDGYGYDIIRYIEEKTQGHYNIKQSSVYSVLKRLEKQGLIASYLGQESQGGPRRYYSLTEMGKEFLNSEKQQWKYTRTLLDSLVSDSPFDLEEDTPPFQPSELRPLTRRGRTDDENTPIALQNATTTAKQQQYVNEFDKLKVRHNASEISHTLSQVQTEKSAENKNALRTLFSNEAESSNKSIQKPHYQETIKENDKIQMNSNTKSINPEYKNIFRNIYKASEVQQDSNKPKQIPLYKDEEIDCHHINDLRNVLKNEGHTLKSYKSGDILGINKKDMVHSNRLFLDTSLLTFLFYALVILILYRFRVEFSYSSNTLLIMGACGLIMPLIGLIKFLIEPKRRQKATFNFKIAFSYSVMIFLFVFVLNLIICLVSPSIGLTIKDLQLYPPIIVATFIPFSVIFYQLLCKSSIYKVKGQ